MQIEFRGFWINFMFAMIALFLLGRCSVNPAWGQPWRSEKVAVTGGERIYWHIQPGQFQDFATHNGGAHVCTMGRVEDVRHETDGDWSVRLVVNAPKGTKAGDQFVVLEIIPEYPLARPTVGMTIRACGIIRYDGKHKWWEIHPLLRWEREVR